MKIKTHAFLVLAFCLAFIAGPTNRALALVTISGDNVTVDFDDFGVGKIIDTQYLSGGSGGVPALSGRGFSVSVTNPNYTQPVGTQAIAVLYGTDVTGGDDPDLERGAGWAGGNAAASTLGRVLIIQEGPQGGEPELTQAQYDARQISASGGYDPDDNAGGGTITFTFELGLTSFGFTWIDLDGGNNPVMTLRNTATGVYATISLLQFVDPNGGTGSGNTPFYYTRAGVDWGEFDVPLGPNPGDRYANTHAPVTIAEISASASAINLRPGDSNTSLGWLDALGDPTSAPDSFNEVTFTLQGSGSIGEIAYSVPEPTSAVLILGSLAGLFLRRNRRRNLV